MIFERSYMSFVNDYIIGKTQQAVDLKKLISTLGASDAPAIIFGPTGSGKELVAQALHEESRRKGAFIAINCAAIPQELLEAELFGYEKGSFTGAIKTTKGKFELAHNGTIFLDEIGDMPAPMQSKLLRVLENSKIQKIGSEKEISLNLRIVCASHKNLEDLVKQNLFREDLFFRLNVFPIKVPSLKERSDDLPLLIEHLIAQKLKNRRINPPSFSIEAEEALRNYDWPGNIREVRNVVERALLFFCNKQINADDVRKFLIRFETNIINRADEQNAIWDEFDNLSLNITLDENDYKIPEASDFKNLFKHKNSIDLRVLLRDIEIVLIKAAMERNSNNTSEAAKDLKLLRTTLIEKIKKYGI